MYSEIVEHTDTEQNICAKGLQAQTGRLNK